MSSPVKVTICKKLLVTNSEYDFEEFIYQVAKLEDYDCDEEIKSDDIKESSEWWHWVV